MRTYNDFSDACISDMESYGDSTGMTACWQELGLNTPLFNSFGVFEEPDAVLVEEVI